MKHPLTIFIVIILFSITSCKKKDLLELAPQVNQTSATFFKSQTHFEQALTGVYSVLRDLPVNSIFMDEMRSDNVFFTFFPGDRSQALHAEALAQFVDDDRNNYTTNRYSSNYIGISRANTLLAKIADFTEMPENIKKEIVAEAKFLRAFFYFDLATHYGGVPLHLDEIKSPDESFLPRSTVEEVYSQILQDLGEAIPDLPEVQNFPQSGHASKGAGRMLLAYAYMSMPEKKFELAKTQLIEILKMNYSLMDNYEDCFDPASKNNKESIFEVQFRAGNDGLHSDFNWRLLPKTANAAPIIGLNVAIQSITWGGWAVPTAKFVNSYESGDKRLNASVGVAEGIIQSNGSFLIEQVRNAEGYVPNPGKVYYYYINKYFHPPYAVEYQSGENWPVFRYADALLLLAECVLKEGNTSDALTYTNRVRKRAGLPDLTTITADLILNERRHELAFESHRWLDLLRTGTAIEVMREHGNAMKQEFGWVLPNAFNITQERLVYPLPFREVQLNNNLVQNAGY